MTEQPIPRLDDLIERLQADRSCLIAGGTPVIEISKLEQDLHIALPRSLVTFLKAFDGGEFPFARIHCVSASGAGWFDFRRECREFFRNAPLMGLRSLLPFARGYGGETYCFDLSQGKKDDPPIVEFDHSSGEDDFTQVSDNLAAWIFESYEWDDSALEVYLVSDAELDGIANLAKVTEESQATRCYLSDKAANKYRLSLPEPLEPVDSSEETETNPNDENLQEIAVTIMDAVKRTGKPVYLFIFCNGEMSTHPKYKKVIGNLTIGKTAHELLAGDLLKIDSNLNVSEIPRDQLENHVPVERPVGERQCNFCGKPASEVKKLIAGPATSICDQCLDLCSEIIDEERMEESGS